MHSKLASGFFDVAVRDSFPVTGVEFVSISLGTIYIPQVVDKPSWMLEEGEALHSPPGAFSWCPHQGPDLAGGEMILGESVLGPILAENRRVTAGGLVPKCAL